MKLSLKNRKTGTTRAPISGYPTGVENMRGLRLPHYEDSPKFDMEV